MTPAIQQPSQGGATQPKPLSGRPGPSASGLISGAWSLAICALAAVLLLAVAIFNGYPTVFSDTGGYLWTGAFLQALAPFRAPGYSILMRFTALFGTAWPTITLQSIIVVYLLWETYEQLVGSAKKFGSIAFLMLVLVLTLLTSLPWVVSLLMPDVFAGTLFLSVFLLVFGIGMSAARRICLALILLLSASAHTSLLPMALLFAVAALLLRFVTKSHRDVPARTALLWLGLPMLASGLSTAALNREMDLGFSLEPSGNRFLLARLFSDGLAADYLRDNCSRRPFVSCRYLADLPRTQEEFLFRHPLLHDLEGHEAEMREIVHGTVLSFPFRFVADSGKDTLMQLATFQTGDEIRTYAAREWNASVIQRLLPRDFPAFSNARQFQDRLPPLANLAAAIDTAVFWTSLGGCLLFAWTNRFGQANELFYCALLFLAINAAICATFAGVYARYQSRVAWIVPLCLLIYVCSWLREAPNFLHENEPSEKEFVVNA